jgi:hypothetical protein
MAKARAAKELDPAIVERIRESITEWKPGLWAEVRNYGPACTCGLRDASAMGTGAQFKPDDPTRCYRHGRHQA